MRSIIFHVDLDAFYASIEQRDNPALKGKPVIVGAKPGTRGVVSACSYEARRFGLRSAMPISEAYRKCPRGIYLPVRMERYCEVSRKVMSILESYSPDFRQISIDEAFLDMTGTQRLFGLPLDVAKDIKTHVFRETGLTLSIGIAPNRYLAKLASEAGKPDGLCMISPGGEEAFLDGLSLKHLWGIGKKTYGRLSELNILSIPQLRKYPLHMLTSMLGEASGRFLYNAARGTVSDIHADTPKSHSLSNEVTFETDRKDRDGLHHTILELSHHLMFRLMSEESKAKTVVLKLRYSDFTTLSARRTLKHWVVSTEELYRTAKDLFDNKWDGHTEIRLIGVGAANVKEGEAAGQTELFEELSDKKRHVEEAVFRIKTEMNGVSITKARLLKKEEEENGDE
ncbi:MAG: DNA polymerase IV [Spirochaetales bacterium]|nr:DNA polymerase IV [Spirochaetales bacterium]